ncbi:MAG: hypothetical protein MZV70_11455 [Desulfobacterales bacterium]|nr:hypothetical protein [Desulfobacterales bacterium]
MFMKLTNKFIKLKFITFAAFIVLISCNTALAQIAILSSNASERIYSNKHIANYSELMQEVIYTFSNSNLKYDVICENDLNELTVNQFNIVIIPLLADINQEAYLRLENYIRSGGKVILIFPDIDVGKNVDKLSEIIGVQQDIPKRTIFKTFVNWHNRAELPENDFPTQTKFASLIPLASAKTLAFWNQSQENIPAIAISDAGGYIGWRWGNDGNLGFNVNVIKYVLESLVRELLKKNRQKLILPALEKKLTLLKK